MGIETAITLLLGLLNQATAIGNLISKAKAEGRDITKAELTALQTADDNARKALQAAIDGAK